MLHLKMERLSRIYYIDYHDRREKKRMMRYMINQPCTWCRTMRIAPNMRKTTCIRHRVCENWNPDITFG